MFCYNVKNKVNDKMYIGITIRNINDRFRRHKSDINNGSNSIFHKAVRKYGFGNFEFEWIKDYTDLITYNELKEIEIEKIIKYNTYVNFKNSNGYNMTFGGDGQLGNGKQVYQFTLDGKIIKNFNSLTEASEKTGVNVHCIGFCCNNKQKSAGGFLWALNNISPTYLNNNLKVVKQYDLELNYINVFKTLTIASNKTGISISSISSCCYGNYKTAGGYVWAFEGNSPFKKHKHKNSKKVYQYDLNLNLLFCFESLVDASKQTGINIQNISSCGKGKRKTAGKFIWRFSKI